MKNYESFIKNTLNEDVLNENIFRNMFGNIARFFGKVPGKKDTDKLINEFKNKYKEVLKRATGVDLQKQSAAKESNILRYDNFLNQKLFEKDVDTTGLTDDQPEIEDKEKNVKITKQSLQNISSLLVKQKNLLLKELKLRLDDELKKREGKNAEKLKRYQEYALLEFEKFMIEEDIKFYEKVGNKDYIEQVKKERENVDKKIKHKYNEITKEGTYKTGEKDQGNFRIGNVYRRIDGASISNILITNTSEKEQMIKGKILQIGKSVDQIEEKEYEIRTLQTVEEVNPGVGDFFQYINPEGQVSIILIKDTSDVNNIIASTVQSVGKGTKTVKDDGFDIEKPIDFEDKKTYKVSDDTFKISAGRLGKRVHKSAEPKQKTIKDVMSLYLNTNDIQKATQIVKGDSVRTVIYNN